MKRILLLASAVAVLVTTACDELIDELGDELVSQLDDEVDGGNDTLTDSGLIKSATVVSDDDDDETLILEFGYDGTRMSEMISTWTCEDGEQFEEYIKKYTYEYSDAEIKVIRTRGVGTEESSNYYVITLNTDGWIASYGTWSSYEETESYVYTYDNQRLDTYVYNDTSLYDYTWSDDNLTKMTFYIDDTYTITSTYTYSSKSNNLNIDLATLVIRGDYNEFENAFTSDFFGIRPANLVREEVHYDSSDGRYNVKTFEYTYNNDEQITEIKVIRKYAESQAEIGNSTEYVTTITLEYYQ